MAYIRFKSSGDIEWLSEYHAIGRKAEAVSTHLDFDFVSKLHAIIEWKDPHWVIRDMSSNGTWVNGSRLPIYTTYLLKKNDLIEVAGGKGIAFEVMDIGMPVDMIYKSDHVLESRPLSEDILLPDELSPTMELYKCPERFQWFAQHIDSQNQDLIELGPFEHKSKLKCEGDSWEFFLVNESDETRVVEESLNKFSDVEFRFDMSQDEESTTLTLIHGTQEMDLFERTHHYLLVHLLRYQQSQKSATEESVESLGWMDCQVLARDLGIDQTHLNIQVFRARQQISLALVGYVGSSHLFERRRGSIRVGIHNCSLYKEGKREL